ncbi:MAG: hypothetical protein PHS14_18650 [Elusimicrobia bacterium]|nr:hypothetical protein [Elusimicrobiota bacterium]
MHTLQTGQAIGKICGISGKSIASTALQDLLHELYPGHPRGKRWAIGLDVVRLIASYWAEWGGRKTGRVGIREWLAAHSMAIPALPDLAPVPVAVKPKKEKPAAIDEVQVSIILEKRLEVFKRELVESIQAAAPVKQLAAPRGRENDPRIFKIHKRINAFTFSEPVRIDDVWNFLRSRFEARNDVKVLLVGAQTFPQWLLSEDWVDTFLQEYEGFLDELHDKLAQQGRLAL